MVIKEFKGKYRFLSNFYVSPIEIDGLTYNTVEHWFQSQKTEDPKEKTYIREAKTPTLSKKRGKEVSLRKDWEDIRLGVMEKGLNEKFIQHPNLAEKLLLTGDELLEEGNNWSDLYWGIDLHTNKGSNHLGKLLMKIRKELKQK